MSCGTVSTDLPATYSAYSFIPKPTHRFRRNQIRRSFQNLLLSMDVILAEACLASSSAVRRLCRVCSSSVEVAA